MSQLSLFDHSASVAARDAGMSLAAANHTHLLSLARRIAKDIACSTDGTADAQQVGQRMALLGVSTLGNWAGSIFKESCWVPIGRTNNTRIAAHARSILRWRYIG